MKYGKVLINDFFNYKEILDEKINEFNKFRDKIKIDGKITPEEYKEFQEVSFLVNLIQKDIEFLKANIKGYFLDRNIDDLDIEEEKKDVAKAIIRDVDKVTKITNGKIEIISDSFKKLFKPKEFTQKELDEEVIPYLKEQYNK